MRFWQVASTQLVTAAATGCFTKITSQIAIAKGKCLEIWECADSGDLQLSVEFTESEPVLLLVGCLAPKLDICSTVYLEDIVQSQYRDVDALCAMTALGDIILLKWSRSSLRFDTIYVERIPCPGPGVPQVSGKIVNCAVNFQVGRANTTVVAFSFWVSHITFAEIMTKPVNSSGSPPPQVNYRQLKFPLQTTEDIISLCFLTGGLPVQPGLPGVALVLRSKHAPHSTKLTTFTCSPRLSEGPWTVTNMDPSSVVVQYRSETLCVSNHGIYRFGSRGKQQLLSFSVPLKPTAVTEALGLLFIGTESGHLYFLWEPRPETWELRRTTCRQYLPEAYSILTADYDSRAILFFASRTGSSLFVTISKDHDPPNQVSPYPQLVAVPNLSLQDRFRCIADIRSVERINESIYLCAGRAPNSTVVRSSMSLRMRSVKRVLSMDSRPLSRVFYIPPFILVSCLDPPATVVFHDLDLKRPISLSAVDANSAIVFACVWRIDKAYVVVSDDNVRLFCTDSPFEVVDEWSPQAPELTLAALCGDHLLVGHDDAISLIIVREDLTLSFLSSFSFNDDLVAAAIHPSYIFVVEKDSAKLLFAHWSGSASLKFDNQITMPNTVGSILISDNYLFVACLDSTVARYTIDMDNGLSPTRSLNFGHQCPMRLTSLNGFMLCWSDEGAFIITGASVAIPLFVDQIGSRGISGGICNFHSPSQFLFTGSDGDLYSFDTITDNFKVRLNWESYPMSECTALAIRSFKDVPEAVVVLTQHNGHHKFRLRLFQWLTMREVWAQEFHHEIVDIATLSVSFTAVVAVISRYSTTCGSYSWVLSLFTFTVDGSWRLELVDSSALDVIGDTCRFLSTKGAELAIDAGDVCLYRCCLEGSVLVHRIELGPIQRHDQRQITAYFQPDTILSSSVDVPDLQCLIAVVNVGSPEIIVYKVFLENETVSVSKSALALPHADSEVIVRLIQFIDPDNIALATERSLSVYRLNLAQNQATKRSFCPTNNISLSCHGSFAVKYRPTINTQSPPSAIFVSSEGSIVEWTDTKGGNEFETIDIKV